MHKLIRSSLAALGAMLLPLVADAQAAKPARVFPVGQWDVLWRIGHETDILFRPEMFAVSKDRVVVFDYGDHSVKSFKLGGGLEWMAGRKGQGPGEYSNPTDILVDQGGQTIVLDPENARLTYLSPAGKLVKTVRLEHSLRRMAGPLPGGSLLALPERPDPFVVVLDSLGREIETAAPPQWLAGLVPITRSSAAVRAIGPTFVIAFRWASSLLQVGRDGKEIKRCVAIDSVAFPSAVSSPIRRAVDGGVFEGIVTRPDPTARVATRGLIAYDNRLGVYPKTIGADSLRIVDLYSAPCGAYQESRRLPFEPKFLGATGDSLVALVDDPLPHLIMLRWRRVAQ